jgi:hypothetical protein
MPYQINDIVVRTHRGMDVKLGIHNHDHQCRLEALLDLRTIKRSCHKHCPLQGRPRHHVEKAPLLAHQGQDLPLMIGGDNSSTRHAGVYQAPHGLEERLDPLHLWLRGAVHPFLGHVLVPTTRKIRKERVIMISEVKSLLMPPLVGRNPLHGYVLIGPGIVELECTTTDIHRRRAPLLRRFEEDGAEKVVLAQDVVGLNAK